MNTVTEAGPGAARLSGTGPAPARAPGTVTDIPVAALRFHAAGFTGADVRSCAADPDMIWLLALLCGITEDEALAVSSALADRIDSYAAAALTPEGAYRLVGLDKALGRPFSEFALAARSAPAVAA